MPLSDHRGRGTRAVTSELGGDIGMHMDIVHGNESPSEQRARLVVVTEWGDI